MLLGGANPQTRIVSGRLGDVRRENLRRRRVGLMAQTTSDRLLGKVPRTLPRRDRRRKPNKRLVPHRGDNQGKNPLALLIPFRFPLS